MKILFVGNTSWSMVNFRLEVMEALSSDGHTIAVAAPTDDLVSKIIDSKFRYFEIKSLERKGISPIGDLKLCVELLKIYYKFKPDYLFHYTIKPNIWGSLSAGFLNIFCNSNIKIVSLITGLGYVFIKDNWLTKIVAKLFKCALLFNYRIVFLNNDDRLIFRKLKIIDDKYSKCLLLKGEGVNLQYFTPNPDAKTLFAPKKFLFVARLLKDKGIYELVMAAKIIKEKYPKVKIQILGSLDQGNPASIEQKELLSWVADGLIEYLGVTTDVRPFMQQATAVVLPSYQEGLSRVLMEALAIGKPIVTTNVQGCKELVDEGKNGFIVPVRDANELANALEKICLLSENELNSFSEYSRNKSFSFSVDKTIKFYQELIDCTKKL